MVCGLPCSVRPSNRTRQMPTSELLCKCTTAQPLKLSSVVAGYRSAPVIRQAPDWSSWSLGLRPANNLPTLRSTLTIACIRKWSARALAMMRTEKITGASNPHLLQALRSSVFARVGNLANCRATQVQSLWTVSHTYQPAPLRFTKCALNGHIRT